MDIKKIPALLYLLLCTVCFTACSQIEEGIIDDYAPIVLRISVQDTKGNDLLNKGTANAVINRGVIVFHNGKIYKTDIPIVRAYKAEMQGLKHVMGADGKYYLTFGEFGGNVTYDGEEVILDWNDGTRDVITFSNELIKESKGERIFNRAFYLNGELQKVSDGTFTIIKDTDTPNNYKPGVWRIADIRYAIEADKKDEIEADLKENSPFTKEDGYIFQNATEYTLVDAQNSVKESGTCKVMDTLDHLVPPKSLVPSNQIITSIKFVFTHDNKERTCYTLLVNSPDAIQRYPVYDLWMYEDLTDYYKTKYPNAGVQKVTRLHISKYYLSAEL